MDYEQRANQFIEDCPLFLFIDDNELKTCKEMLIDEYKQLIEDHEEDKKDKELIEAVGF